MGIVAITTFTSDTETVTRTKLNGLSANLLTEFNGNIENSNIKAGAAIANSKLNLANISQAVQFDGATTFAANVTFASQTISDLGSVTTADINGGTIDGTVIGGNSAAAGTFSTLTATTSVLTSVDINGGTIGGVTLDGSLTISLGSDADGDIYYRSSNVLTRLAKGSSGNILRMNTGATAPEWSSSFVSDVFTTAGAGTWTAPTSVNYVWITMVGAGGGGGGGEGSSGGRGGGGGEGGQGVLRAFYRVTPGVTYDFTIGAGGIGGSGAVSGNDATAGTDGADTTFNDNNEGTGEAFTFTLTAAGGDGGTNGTSGGGGAGGSGEAEAQSETTPAGQAGTAGGSGSGGGDHNYADANYLKFEGGSGGAGNSSSPGQGGGGGGSFIGAGGAGSTVSATPGSDASEIGGGGGGGTTASSGNAGTDGGDGGDGIIIIEYIT